MYIYFKILGSIQDLPTESLEVGLGLFCKSPTAQTHAGLWLITSDIIQSFRNEKKKPKKSKVHLLKIT